MYIVYIYIYMYSYIYIVIQYYRVLKDATRFPPWNPVTFRFRPHREVPGDPLGYRITTVLIPKP